MPVDLDELERLHKAAAEVTKGEWAVNSYSYGNAIPGSFEYTIEHDGGFGIAEMHSSLDQPKSVATFIAAIKNACDDGLLERLRTAVRELALLSDPEAVRVNIMRGTIAKPDDLVFLHDTNGPVAALKAENERLRNGMRDLIAAIHAWAWPVDGERVSKVHPLCIAASTAGTTLETTNG